MSTRTKPLLARIRFSPQAFGLALVLACLSSYIERTGPEMAAYGNLCGSTPSDPCHQPVLKGGFPVAFLFDAPGVSVEHRLSFGEDNVDVMGWLIDWAIYAVVSVVLLPAFGRRRGEAIK